MWLLVEAKEAENSSERVKQGVNYGLNFDEHESLRVKENEAKLSEGVWGQALGEVGEERRGQELPLTWGEDSLRKGRWVW